MINWNPPETAPKDKPILADLGWMYPRMAIWNEHDKKWAYAEVALDAEDDPYFQTDLSVKIKGWIALEVCR